MTIHELDIITNVVNEHEHKQVIEEDLGGDTDQVVDELIMLMDEEVLAHEML